jgi:putrescine transport system substrate-binding protein
MMQSTQKPAWRFGLLSALVLSGTALAGEEKVLNFFSWPDYIAEDTIANFEKRTGIRVNHDVYDSNEMLEAKLLAGSSGYDVVVPSASFLERQIKAGVFQRVDKNQLSNYGNLDADILSRVAVHDANNEHGVPYMWGTTGIGYNQAKVAELLPNAPVDSWDMLFDPEVIAKLSKCGVTFLDAPTEVFAIALAYLGRSPNSEDPDDLKAAEEMLAKVRPHIRYIHSQQYINDLANGEICVAMSWSGDVFAAGRRAAEAGNGVNLSYSIPRQGSVVWFDVMAIPASAPHPGNAHLFIDYILEPAVAAGITDHVRFANSNTASHEFVDESITGNPGIYPPEDVKAKLFPAQAHGSRFTRTQTRAWTRFKTGR